MVKKKVPDWLNSSLWSAAPPPEDDRLHRFALKPIAAAAADLPLPVAPPAPAPVVVSTKDYIPTPQLIDDSHSLSNSNNSSDDENGSSAQAQLLTELSKKEINMRELRRIASQGIPDGGGIRSTVWKLLLGYLPPDRSLWSSELARERSQYKHFKEELLMNPETDLHTKRTGHTDFEDKTSEAAKPISLEVPKVADDSAEAMDVDGSSSSQPEEMVVPEVDKTLLEELEAMGFPGARATRALHYSEMRRLGLSPEDAAPAKPSAPAVEENKK